MAVRTLLSDQNPFPEAIDGRLREQLEFIIEVDKLKAVLRQSPLAAAERRENDAEHSWHLALMVLLLAEYANEPIDVGHTIKLVVVHDLIEVYAGDTPLYLADEGQAERERAAADELFAILPDDQRDWIRALWDEFEERATPEARFGKALDRFQPVLLNWMAKGGTWQAHNADIDNVLRRTAAIEEGSNELGAAREVICAESVRKGWLRPGG